LVVHPNAMPPTPIKTNTRITLMVQRRGKKLNHINLTHWKPCTDLEVGPSLQHTILK
jgi:hypothetical protein